MSRRRMRRPFRVIQHIRPKFSCRLSEGITQAPPPELPIRRGRATAGLLAHVLVAKFADHLPLYRQSEIYAREGVELERSTLADWVGQSAALLHPLVDALERHVMAGERVHADGGSHRARAMGARHARAGARAWGGQDQDRAALGLSAWRAPSRGLGGTSGGLPLQPRPKGRAPAHSSRRLQRRAARGRLQRVRWSLRCRSHHRGGMLGPRAAQALRPPPANRRLRRKR
jgi:hypothetical protein